MITMGTILELSKLDFSALVIGMFYLLSAIIAMTTTAGRFSELIGRPIRWSKKKQENHDLFIWAAKNLDVSQQKHEEDAHQSIHRGGIVREDLKKLTNMFTDKEISDLRWEVIKFSATIAEGEPRGKGNYRHCIRTYEKYERLLADNDMESGEVEFSMELVQESYKEKLKNGF